MADVEHFWPGKSVGGLPYSVTYDSSFIDALPYNADPNTAGSSYKIPGYDSGAPWADTTNPARSILDGPGNGLIVWSIMGTGDDVVFDAMTTTANQGVVVFLLLPGLTPGYLNERGWVFVNSTPNANTHVTFRQNLAAGSLYYLAVCSYGGVAGSDGVTKYGQTFTVSVAYADGHHSAPVNDLRANATKVVSDGTYLSVDTELSYAQPGAIGVTGPYLPDTEAQPLYQTAWWSYTPYLTGSASFRAHSVPTDDEHARIEILDENLTVLGVTGMSQDLVFPVTGGHTYYIALGTSDPATPLTASFGLVGPITAGVAPHNDLRANATAVSIPADGGTYLSVDTLLTFANPGAVGSIGPYVWDAEASPLFQTAWWVYRPKTPGTVQIRAHSDPVDQPAVKLMILHALTAVDEPIGQPPSALTALASVTMSMDYSHDVVAGATYYYVLGTIDQESVSASFGMTGPTTVAPTDPGPYIPPVIDPTTLPTDPYTPDATQPGLDSGQDTLLNLVRAFSSQVKRAVRIVGPTTIEMVDPVALPHTGDPLDGATAEDLYHAASIANAATDVVLSTNVGDVTVTGSAQFVTNDIRLVKSTWRIPDRLPFYRMPPSAVQRVTLTFSPTAFTAAVDFYFPSVPLAARRP